MSPKLSTSFGARIERITTQIGDTAFPNNPGSFGYAQTTFRPTMSNSEFENALNLGIDFQLNRYLNIYGHIGRSYRTPTLDERSGTAYALNTFELKNQSSKEVEAGALFKFNDILFDTRIFYSKTRDEIQSIVRSAVEAKEHAERMLGSTLVTIQTGEEGKQVNTLFVEQGLKIARELYLGIVVDRTVGGPVLIMSSEGGMEIEKVAAESPEKILSEPFDAAQGLFPYQARKLAYALGFSTKAVRSAEKLLPRLCRFFVDHDCSMTEINPLVLTDDDELLALDAKVSFDDNAMFRHKSLLELRDLTEEDPAEVKAGDAGLSYVNLDGSIGCLVNGAGLAMSTMDLIKIHGAEPANFLDVGGGADVDQVTEAFRIILSDDAVKAVLVNIFGGIMRCDVIVEALLGAYEKVGFSVPLVVPVSYTHLTLPTNREV